LSLPQTVIHGEFYPSNVLVAGTSSDPMPCPLDWEMAAIGPGVVDLAALTCGEWQPDDRLAAIAAYADGANAHGDAFADVTEGVEYASVHLAVQWLGWFGRRQAPAGHVRDWLADAVDRAEALRL
jgi:aminoglycoside phosphotransferase (APT) family kinase protein